jgi:hypothetical protein
MSGFLCSMVGVSPAVAAGRTAKTVTTVGNAQVSTAQSKFGGASALFDGTGDALDISTLPDFGFGTGAFTVECWVRFASVSGTPTLWDTRTAGAGTQGLSPYLSSGQLRIYTNTTGSNIISGSTTLSTNTWYHIAVTRDGSNNLKLFLNGTQEGSTYTTSINLGSDRPFRIGDNITANAGMNGYIDELRVSNSARYTANFTAPTTAFTSDVNTLLLLHCNGSNTTTVFTDDIGTNAQPRTPRTITVGGNAKVSTAQFKYGTASGLYDGTSDYLSVPGFSDLAFGTGDFTLEAWVRQSARSDQMTIFDTRNSGNTSGGFILYVRADNVMELYWNSAYASSANPLPTVNTWYHVAVSRSGTALKVFVDGTSVISVTDSQNHSAAGPFIIGQDFQLTGTPGNSWNGYIDEVRFSATARYTANFTAPTAAFTNDRDTLLLLHCEGANLSTTFTDDNA